MAFQTFTNTTIAHELNAGDGWYAALEFEDGTVIFSDTLTEILGELLDGYGEDITSEAGAEQAFNARVDFAVRQANARQGLLALIATDDGDFDPEVESEDTLTAIFSDRDEYIPVVELWDGKVPLVLISTEYEPFTEIPKPTGNVQWVNPATDLTLLSSLAELGAFELRILG